MKPPVARSVFSALPRLAAALILPITAGMLVGSGAALAASNACKADLNGDLVVNFADLAVLKSVFFQSCSPTCGDGVVQSPWEQCDDGNVRDGDGCSRKCEIEGPLPLVCGDGMAVTPEQCDDGNLLDGDGCSSVCTIEVPLTVVCGNGVAQGPTEECDDGNLTNWDGCSSTCQMERPGTTSGLEDRGLTVFDHGTGLEWEKKTDDGGLHDKDNYYSWSPGPPWNPDGTAFTVFLAALNGGAALGVSADGVTTPSGPCYASHCDWRLPTVSELRTILDCSYGPPCVAPIFGPTQSSDYWSSSSIADYPDGAWLVDFSYGNANANGKTYSTYVRAVRGAP